jgi:hypothetical protein
MSGLSMVFMALSAVFTDPDYADEGGASLA